MTLTPIKASLSAWVIAASGLVADQVVWTKQSIGLRLPEPFVTLSFLSLQQIGQPQIRRETRDPVVETVIAGQELRVSADTWHELVVRMQAFGDDALTILEDVRAKVVLPTIRDALTDANLGVNDLGMISEEGGVQGPGLGLRAVMEVTVSVADTVSEFGGYIDWVTIADHLVTPPSYVDVDTSPA